MKKIENNAESCKVCASEWVTKIFGMDQLLKLKVFMIIENVWIKFKGF